MLRKEFDAQIIRPDKKGSLTYIRIPFDAAKEFHSRGRIKVEGTINGFSFRSSLIPKGNGVYILPIDKKMQKEIGLVDSDVLHVIMKPDSVYTGSEVHTGIEKIEACNIDVLSAIRERRSIRKFSDKEIDEKVLNTILEAGLCAPSAKNKRPWHFIVIREKEALNSLSRKDSNHKPIAEAACCIVVCGDKNVQGMNEFLYEDCAASIQNILLASYGLGVGTVWCGLHTGSDSYKFLVEKLQLPVKIVPIAAIALGYPAENRGSEDRFDLVKIHSEKW
ncbi:MAG: nitroreductase family protein [Clostridia bacterium]|nr:nitroreductase family protein [Clostridia bacterium]